MTDQPLTDHAGCREHLGLNGWCPKERAPDSLWCEGHIEERRHWRLRMYGSDR